MNVVNQSEASVLFDATKPVYNTIKRGVMVGIGAGLLTGGLGYGAAVLFFLAWGWVEFGDKRYRA